MSTSKKSKAPLRSVHAAPRSAPRSARVPSAAYVASVNRLADSLLQSKTKFVCKTPKSAVAYMPGGVKTGVSS